MTAHVTYTHPEMGPTTTEVSDYQTQANGTLVAMAAGGYQLLLPASGDWIVTDDEVGE